jgi:hypothetical protein
MRTPGKRRCVSSSTFQSADPLSITSNIKAAAPLGMSTASQNDYFILFCRNSLILKSSGGTVTRDWSIDWPR